MLRLALHVVSCSSQSSNRLHINPHGIACRSADRTEATVHPESHVHGKSQHSHNLHAVSEKHGEDSRSIRRSLASFEGEGPDDVSQTVGDEEHGVGYCSLGGAGCVGCDEGHNHGEGCRVQACELCGKRVSEYVVGGPIQNNTYPITRQKTALGMTRQSVYTHRAGQGWEHI